MRRLTFCLLVLTATAAPAGAQTLSIAGCEVFYSTITPVTDPASGDTIRTEWRRTDGLPVEVRCPDLQVFADSIDLLNQEERLNLRGRVVFQQGGTRIAAVSGTVDLKTRLGSFESASGTLQLTDKQVDRSLFGSMEPEAIFNAARIEKTGPQTYRLTDATFTTCVQPSRRWQVYSSKLTFTVNRYAIMTNARLEVKDVPLLYLPVFYYPISEDDRATGFLMPGYGSSTFRGFTLSNAFFWAINRSQDLTVYHDWFTRTGHGLGADYRYVSHGGTGDVRAGAISQKALLADDGSLVSAGRRSYELRGNLNQPLPGRLRIQGRADYFTDATTSQLYQSDLDAFSRRQRYFGVNLSGSWGLVRGSVQAERNDVFYGSNAAGGNQYLPRINLAVSQTPIAGTKIYVGGSWEGLNGINSRDINDPTTRIALRRSDGTLTIRAPHSFGSALEVQGGMSFRRTDWDIRRDPDSGEIVQKHISRNLLELRGELRGPVFTRIWDTGGNRIERIKHVIEPSVTMVRRSAFVGFDEVVQFDGTDLVVGGNTQIEYRLTNRLLAKIRQNETASAVQQIASLDIAQTYYTDALAAAYDQQYQSSFNGLYIYAPPPSKFSPVQVTLNLTPSTTTSGQFGLEYDARFRAVRTYRASAGFAQPWFDFRGSWSKRQLIPGLEGFDDPLRADHFVTVAASLKRPDRSGSLTYSTTLDILRDRMLQQRLGFFYNAQCCGIAVDYVVVNLSHYGLRNNKQFSLSFSLAGIGSFVNPFGVFGNNDQR